MSFNVLTKPIKKKTTILNEKVNILSSPRTLGYTTKQKLADALGLEFDPANSVKREDIDVVIVSENPHPVQATQAFIEKSLDNGKTVLTFDDVRMILDGSKKLSDFGNISTVTANKQQEIEEEPIQEMPVESPSKENNSDRTIEQHSELTPKAIYNSNIDGAFPDLASCLDLIPRCKTRLRDMIASPSMKFTNGAIIPIAAELVPQEYEADYGVVSPGNGEKYYMPLIADSDQTYDIVKRLWYYCQSQDLMLGEICQIEEIKSKVTHINARVKHLINELDLIRKENRDDPRVNDNRYYTARVISPTKQYRISGIIDGELEPILSVRVDQSKGMYLISASTIAKERIAKIPR